MPFRLLPAATVDSSPFLGDTADTALHAAKEPCHEHPEHPLFPPACPAPALLSLSDAGSRPPEGPGRRNGSVRTGSGPGRTGASGEPGTSGQSPQQNLPQCLLPLLQQQGQQPDLFRRGRGQSRRLPSLQGLRRLGVLLHCSLLRTATPARKHRPDAATP